MRVVLLADDTLFPTNSGGRAEVLGECRALRAAGIEVTLVVSHRQPLAAEEIRLHQQLVDRVFFYRRSSFLKTTMTSPLEPYQIASRIGPSAADVHTVITPETTAIIASHEWTIPLAHQLGRKTDLPVLLRSHNDEVSYMRSLAADAPPVRRLYYHAEAIRLQRRLRTLYSEVDAVAVLSSLDEEPYLRHGVATTLIPPVLAGLTPKTIPERTVAPRTSDLLFVGALDIPHAVQGLDWFLRRVLPQIRSQLPGAALHIAGRRASQHLRNSLVNSPGVVFHGEVKDLDELYTKSRVFINPIFNGSGVNMKMGPPSEYGLPIVTTTVGKRGLGALISDQFVGDDSSAFTKACVELLTADDVWLKTSRKLQEVIQAYSPAAVGTLFSRKLAVLVHDGKLI